MFGVYESVFRDIHALTAKGELDGRPSLLSTVLIVSLLQFSNVVAIGMMVESASAWMMPASKALFVASIAVLAALNYLYSKHLGLRVGEPATRLVRLGSFGVIYGALSIVLFVIAAVWMSRVYEK